VTALSPPPPQAEVATRLDAAVIGRQGSRFAGDMAARKADLRHAIADSRVLVVGACGSIGTTTVDALLEFQPQETVLVDSNENGLAEMMRDLRARDRAPAPMRVQAVPTDYGGPIMRRLLAGAKPFDLVLNFAAMKHVRSEKDLPSLLQIFETNVVKHRRFLNWLAEGGHAARRYFAVSTDKAANPTSLMGASKRAMEELIFAGPWNFGAVSAARFANVAFSNGSVLASLVQRLALRQPLAVPKATKRYFVSIAEAGHICLLAAALGPHRHVVYPKLDPTVELRLLEDVARAVLAVYGLAAEIHDRESTARAAVDGALARSHYPLLLTPLDTGGEKAFEEFLAEGEIAVEFGLAKLAAIPHRPWSFGIDAIVDPIAAAIEDASRPIDRKAIVAALQSVMPQFRHVASDLTLDDRI